MSRKDVEIISLLMSRSDYTSFNDLRINFKISERSVRYEVEKANKLLKLLGLPQIEQNRGLGLKLVFTESQKKKIKSYVKETQDEVVYYTSDERFLFIIFLILNESVPVFGNKLASYLNVSKSTIDSNMKKIREYVEGYGLFINSIPKKGFKLIGNEWDIRIMMNNTVNKFIDADRIIGYYNGNKTISKKEIIVVNFLDEELVLWIYLKLRELSRLSDYNISDVNCRQVTVIFAIWFKRISKEYFLKSENLKINYEEKLHEYETVNLFIEDVQKQYGIRVGELEKYYLCYLLDSFNIRCSNSLKGSWGGTQMVTLQFIEKMELLTLIPFSKDKDLFQKLYPHIEALLKRLKKKISISNPLNNMVAEYYSDIFNASKKAVEIIEKYSGEKISNDEISYLAIHFSVSKEKLAQYSFRRHRVVIICGHGVATGELLAENLRKFYHFDIVGIVNSNDIQAIKRLNVDFAFSTIDSKFGNLPSLTINPFLSDYDRKKINKFLKANSKTSYTSVSNFNFTNFFKEICTISENNNMKIDIEKFVNDLTNVFEKNGLVVDKKGVQPMISEVLTDKQILLKKEAKDWEESIRMVAQPLLEENYINDKYVSAMINSIKEYGPYIVIGKGIALAHARPEDGVNKLGLSILTLSKPISFGDDNDPVEIVFCLAATDNFSHLKIMKTLVSVVNEEWKLNKLIEQQSIEEFKKIIYKLEEE